jgi:hypothetical protein
MSEASIRVAAILWLTVLGGLALGVATVTLGTGLLHA